MLNSKSGWFLVSYSSYSYSSAYWKINGKMNSQKYEKEESMTMKNQKQILLFTF